MILTLALFGSGCDGLALTGVETEKTFLVGITRTSAGLLPSVVGDPVLDLEVGEGIDSMESP